jgi:hypothetical protein
MKEGRRGRIRKREEEGRGEEGRKRVDLTW